MNQIYQKSFSGEQSAGKNVFKGIKEPFAEPAERVISVIDTNVSTAANPVPNTKVIPVSRTKVIPEGCSRESQPYNMSKRLGLPNPAGRQTFGNDWVGAERPGLPEKYSGHLKRKMRAGFTLIELLVVVLIIGILAAVALPQYQVAVDKAEFTSYTPAIQAMMTSQRAYYMANGGYAGALEDLDILPIFKGKYGAYLRMDAQEAYWEPRGAGRYQYRLKYATGKVYCTAFVNSDRYNRLCKSVSGASAPEYEAAWYNYYLLGKF